VCRKLCGREGCELRVEISPSVELAEGRLEPPRLTPNTLVESPQTGKLRSEAVAEQQRQRGLELFPAQTLELEELRACKKEATAHARRATAQDEAKRTPRVLVEAMEEPVEELALGEIDVVPEECDRAAHPEVDASVEFGTQEREGLGLRRELRAESPQPRWGAIVYGRRPRSLEGANDGRLRGLEACRGLELQDELSKYVCE